MGYFSFIILEILYKGFTRFSTKENFEFYCTNISMIHHIPYLKETRSKGGTLKLVLEEAKRSTCAS